MTTVRRLLILGMALWFALPASAANFHAQTLGDSFPLSPTGAVLASYTFVNTTDQIEWIFQVQDPADGTRQVTITKLGYRLTSVTGTSPVMKISIQGVDGSGNPDGTIKGGASPASATFTPSGSNTWNWVTLANAYTANVGDYLAIVIAYSSGTLNGSNTPVIGVTLSSAAPGFPYQIQNVAGVRTRSASLPVYGYSSAAKAFGYPIQGVTLTTITNPAERAVRFMLETNLVSTYKVAGVRMQLSTPAAGKSNVITLYQGTTVLQQVTWDSDYTPTAAANVRAYTFWFDSTNPLATLYGGQEYRIGIAPQDAGNNVTWNQLDFAAQADMEALSGGQQWYLSTRASGGATAWTDTVTSRPICELIVSDWTTPSPGIVVAQ